MFFRLSICSLLTLVLACASDLEPVPAASMAAHGSLAFEPPMLSLVPGESADLRVRYHDASGAAVPGKQVQFSLTGVTSGASLTPASALTDADGAAITKLRVGSMPATLRVRATTDDGALAYLDVSVDDDEAATLSVQVSYQGQRKLAAYTMTALSGKTCAQVRNTESSGELVYTVTSPSEAVRFPLAAGALAVVAWGKDETGAKLARGCTDVPAGGGARSAVVVELQDTQMSLDKQLPLELELDLATPTARLTDMAKRAVDTVLAPGGSYAMFAEADYYLDAIASALEQQGASTSDALAQLASLRSSTALSSSLSPALARAGVGPRAVAAQLGGLLAARGAGLTLRTTYDAGSLAAPTSLSAMSADGTKALSLNVRPSVPLSARFDASLAKLVINQLGLELGLGTYGRAVLQALDREDAASLQASLAAASGCRDVVAAWWEKSEAASLAEASTVRAGCEQAVAKLRAAVDAALDALDDQHPTIELSGAAQLYDRSEDGVVDDLGPTELNGVWGGDNVVGELRVPAKTAFAD